ncbi:class I SAM-dependent methyltransferase [Cytobacillus purgationiresistens]|uniref:SAM-dependent methyltransferase n=1 Tax=Cytobacillus purgationiresistens TaxID=863449 RepID=A0ABU0AF12_9BACI|nr:class I SAM-dependent methyltransferase [Cytobacillus purgationiresistens]MDQ0269843.1 SAM-dependent methyltransferase [Cytobacillus purgationiresistens]
MSARNIDQLLNIKTAEEQMGFNASFHYHRYEPTPYEALEALFNEYDLSYNGRLVDLGCGKGRLNFYVNHFHHKSAIGIEMNEAFFHDAMENLRAYERKMKKNNQLISFECCFAEEYSIHPTDQCFYFFNPFTIQIFIKVVNNILLSIQQVPRLVELILYYPSEDYIFYLENHTAFMMKQEVVLAKNKNEDERFLIYKLQI